MNKKLLSLAVAAAFAAPMAVQASEMSVYGVANVALTNINPDAGNNAGADYWDLVSGASRLGVKGSEDLGNGLKAIYKMEFQVRMTDANGNNNIRDNDAGTLSQRNTYVGLAGDWGTFLMGRHDTPLKISTGALDLFGDTIADYNQGGALAAQPVDGLESGSGMAGLGFIDARADNAVAYVSPNMNGFTLAGAIVPAGNSTVFGVDSNAADGLDEAVSLAAMYSNGPFYASLAYETYTTAAINLATVGSLDIVRAGLGYTANNFHVGFVYENEDASAANVDVDVWQLNASYAFGNNVIKAAYGERDAGTGWAASFRDDADQFSVGIDHNFSKKTKAYAVYTDVDSASVGEDWSGLSVGLSTNF
ncbi:MAG: hypothetical protein A2286_04785 [Gammaproteobacteria bacterium RIFOXYA12_FULL_61_12]|nr:MAG: hypothetical protein A2514_12625 [Gammaproteobacteria bacterium RIFOXYD12_FULL_61_37]OGT94012.1 MAG: hypothetical protein A2286_04785 [Gammaproteobacteria bacterium RIFOXYA12_FULL_61_12]